MHKGVGVVLKGPGEDAQNLCSQAKAENGLWPTACPLTEVWVVALNPGTLARLFLGPRLMGKLFHEPELPRALPPAQCARTSGSQGRTWLVRGSQTAFRCFLGAFFSPFPPALFSGFKHHQVCLVPLCLYSELFILCLHMCILCPFDLYLPLFCIIYLFTMKLLQRIHIYVIWFMLILF